MSAPLFDRYVAVDWSGANEPKTGKDSVWIAVAERGADGAVTVVETANPPTREAAMARLRQTMRDALAAGERVFAGFDFPFGYPSGGAQAIAGVPGWAALWAWLAGAIQDRDDNTNNRFEVAARINREQLSAAPMFWGRPAHLDIPGLPVTKPAPGPASLPERRIVETRAPKAQPVWKMAFSGSVGGQALLGMARLESLRQDPEFADHIAVWPFETDFEAAMKAPIVLAEIYPSLVPAEMADWSVKDEAQVAAVAERIARRDGEGRLAAAFAAPADLAAEHRAACLSEEGWILGLGDTLLDAEATDGPNAKAAAAPAGLAYLRDPQAIYRESFRLIREETDVAKLPAGAEPVAVRMVHACGMPDLVDDLTISQGAVEAGRAALAAGAPILCDAEMVVHGITRARLPENNAVICRLSDPKVRDIAGREATTRSAAQVSLWRNELEGSVVAIGNAPTALYALLEALDAGAPKPALIVATPVGFVGAAESKAELARNARGVPFITVSGRRGGSAMAAAAVNAMAAPEEGTD